MGWLPVDLVQRHLWVPGSAPSMAWWLRAEPLGDARTDVSFSPKHCSQ